MFDIGAAELLVIVIVAVLIIGPKDMPKAMRTAGRWIGKVRRVSAHFRSGIDTMIREAELEEMEAKWKARNEEIMAQTGTAEDYASEEMTGPPPSLAESSTVEPEKPVKAQSVSTKPDLDEPGLPLEPPGETKGQKD